MQHYGTIVVVGGGCYGGYYLRQLRRARDARALAWQQLVIVDRDPACAVFAAGAPDFTPVVSDWREYFTRFLDDAALAPSAHAGDAVVPSPLMPHLMFQWVQQRAQSRWPARRVEHVAIGGEVEVPWQRSGDDRTHYVSFATWMCPINCIEPAKCPHTREVRDWSMPVTLRRRAPALRLDGTAVIEVTHRAFGVGMFDVRDVLAADTEVARVGTSTQPVRVLVGTASHCHGAVGVLELSSGAGD